MPKMIAATRKMVAAACAIDGISLTPAQVTAMAIFICARTRACPSIEPGSADGDVDFCRATGMGWYSGTICSDYGWLQDILSGRREMTATMATSYHGAMLTGNFDVAAAMGTF